MNVRLTLLSALGACIIVAAAVQAAPTFGADGKKIDASSPDVAASSTDAGPSTGHRATPDAGDDLFDRFIGWGERKAISIKQKAIIDTLGKAHCTDGKYSDHNHKRDGFQCLERMYGPEFTHLPAIIGRHRERFAEIEPRLEKTNKYALKRRFKDGARTEDEYHELQAALEGLTDDDVKEIIDLSNQEDEVLGEHLRAYRSAAKAAHEAAKPHRFKAIFGKKPVIDHNSVQALAEQRRRLVEEFSRSSWVEKAVEHHVHPMTYRTALEHEYLLRNLNYLDMVYTTGRAGHLKEQLHKMTVPMLEEFLETHTSQHALKSEAKKAAEHGKDNLHEPEILAAQVAVHVAAAKLMQAHKNDEYMELSRLYHINDERIAFAQLMEEAAAEFKNPSKFPVDSSDFDGPSRKDTAPPKYAE